MPKHENNALQKKSYKHSGLVVVECGRVSELCYRHRQKADLEKFSKFRSAKVALYMKASCLVLSFYSF